MDPVSILVTALASGAAAGLKPAAEKAVQDAYAGLKQIITRKYHRVSVQVLEEDPASTARQHLIREDLEKTGAAQDEDLLRHAQEVLDAVERYEPGAAEVVGVRLEQIRGASLKISSILSAGTGIDVRHADLSGDIEIKDVRAGLGGNAPPKPERR